MYQVIARKWRPQTFDEVTGQEVVTQTLKNAILHDRLHHAYLFSGARGVGKTTSARIFAKALNCNKANSPTITPCTDATESPCPSCIEIAESRSMDVLEFDAASNTQVEKIREIILETINIAPARDRFKVFIIDEVHMLSASSFNALLKTVEEPPDNVVFIFATTELHKVPETITSRCQEFQFRTIPLQKIYDRLNLIAEAEKINIDPQALKEIARSGEGSMRDAQSNFDQVISFSGEKIGISDVTSALGRAGIESVVTTIEAVRDLDNAAILRNVDELVSGGHDLRHFCREVLGLIRDLLVYHTGGDEHLLESAIVDHQRLKTLSEGLSSSDLLRFFNSLSQTETLLRDAADPRYLLEIGLIKLAEMKRLTPIDELIRRLAALESRQVPSGEAVNAEEEKKTLKLVEQPSKTKPLQKKPSEKPPFHETAPSASPIAAAPAKKKLQSEDDIPPFDPTNEHYDEPPSDDIDELAPNISNGIVYTYAPPIPPKLSSIELDATFKEHFDESRLDSIYAGIFEADGGGQKQFKEISSQLAKVFGITDDDQRSKIDSPESTKLHTPDVAPVIIRTEAELVIPTLAADPTEKELHEFAHAHPTIGPAIKLFRATISEIRKK